MKMIDDYTHQDSTVMYIAENIPGPKEQSEEYSIIENNFNSCFTDNCDCVDMCRPSECLCCLKSGGANYLRTDGKDYLLNNGKEFPILECNRLCSCSNYCENRVVQKGPIADLYVKECNDSSKGMGLFTKKFIPKGTFICEYAGEVITKSQAIEKQQKNMKENKMNYIFCLNEFSNGQTIQTFVDPSTFGNIGRYINHSCEPNCIVAPVRYDIPIPRLAIFSCENILENSEITFQYGCNNNKDRKDKNINSRKACLCNSEKCLGWMPYELY